MSQIKITINERPYTVVCDDGQEKQLHKLAEFLSGRVKELSDGVGQIGDANLLVMVGLLLSDELSDAYAEITNLKEEIDKKDKLLRTADAVANERVDAAMLDALAEHINGIASKLEQA